MIISVRTCQILIFFQMFLLLGFLKFLLAFFVVAKCLTVNLKSLLSYLLNYTLMIL